MADSDSLVWAGVLLLGIGMISAAGLTAWFKWLAYRRFEIEVGRGSETPPPSAACRIEMANLKERLRKLEAIASGVDP